MSGYLSLHLGCMRAEKSVFATRKATKYADLGLKVLYIRSVLDTERETEGGNNETFTSHSSSNCYLSKKVDTFTCKFLSQVIVDDYNLIVIDEAQFFTDLVEVVLDWVDKRHKTIYAVGLDSSFKRTKIGHLLDLIPHADFYEKFTAKCVECIREGRDPRDNRVNAPFTMRENATKENDEIIKPGNEGYIPVCRRHYNLLNS